MRDDVLVKAYLETNIEGFGNLQGFFSMNPTP
jgi:hypothetical protein